MAVQVGDPVPDVRLSDQHGKPVGLRDFRGRALVVFFYPKDDTPICTREACGFRDAFPALAQAGAAVVGISGDPVPRHLAFADRYQLPYSLLADEGDVARRAFGVPRSLGLFPGRVTYVVDPDGVVRKILQSQLFPQWHVDEALQVVRAMITQAGGGGVPETLPPGVGPGEGTPGR